MPLWAGIDEAGYGPLLGPLVVAATAFRVPDIPKEGALWPLLRDAVTRHPKSADGRVVVDDSKKVYSAARGIRTLEEGVLAFLGTLRPWPECAGELLSAVLGPDGAATDGSPWFEAVGRIGLPLSSNPSALASKRAMLSETFELTGTRLVETLGCVVLPREFNRVVSMTRNKSYLLFQKCGLLLQRLWRMADREEAFVLVDRHGGRQRYRKLLVDAFPDCSCDVLREGPDGSVYVLQDRDRKMWVAFKEGGDRRALPVSLASMTAKYVRELYMKAFNAYWQSRLAGLRATAGYACDARRFLRDVKPLLDEDALDLDSLVRGR